MKLLKSSKNKWSFIALLTFICLFSCEKDLFRPSVEINSLLGTYVGKVHTDDGARTANAEIIVSNLRGEFVDCLFKFLDTDTEVLFDSIFIFTRDDSIVFDESLQDEYIFTGEYYQDSLTVLFEDFNFDSELLFKTKKKQ